MVTNEIVSGIITELLESVIMESLFKQPEEKVRRFEREISSRKRPSPRLPALRGIVKTSPNRPSTSEILRARLHSQCHPLSFRDSSSYTCEKYIVKPPLVKRYVCFRCESSWISSNKWRVRLSAELRTYPYEEEEQRLYFKSLLSSSHSPIQKDLPKIIVIRDFVREVNVVPGSEKVLNEVDFRVLESENSEDLLLEVTIPESMARAMKRFGDPGLAVEILPRYDNITENDPIYQLSEEIAVFSDTHYLRQPKQVLGSVCDYIATLKARERNYIFTDPVLSRAFAQNRRVVCGKNLWKLIQHNFVPLNSIVERVYFRTLKSKSSISRGTLEVTIDSKDIICPKKWTSRDVSSVYRNSKETCKEPDPPLNLHPSTTRSGSLKRNKSTADISPFGGSQDTFLKRRRISPSTPPSCSEVGSPLRRNMSFIRPRRIMK